MGAEAAVGILHRKKLADAREEEREALRAEMIAEQERATGGDGLAMSIGVVDEIIEPGRTRRRLVEAFASAPASRGHHNNIPL